MKAETEPYQVPLLIFLSSFFIFLTFSGTRVFISDEGVILDQFYNFINGSLAVNISKISVGVMISIGDNIYGKFSYSLLVLSLPAYYILKAMDLIYGAHLFILQLWALSGGFIVYLIAKIRKFKHAEPGAIASYLILISINLYLFRPIYFPKWGELLSIEFTNILISSFLIMVVYLLFKDFFGNKIAIFASLLIIFATPVSFYAITLKHHSLTLLLTVLSFYFFHKYQEKKDTKLIYFAYILGGLCLWTRILDGAVLLASLLITDIIILRRKIRYIAIILIIVLISMLPFFIFNYLISGDPVAIMDSYPMSNKPLVVLKGDNFIALGESLDAQQFDLLVRLGYGWNETIKIEWFDIFGYMFFFRLVNTFGIFLVSPFLIISLAFGLAAVRRKITLNLMDKLLIIYVILFIVSSKNYLLSIIIDTPLANEYRYLLILYIVLLYFGLRISRIKIMIENNLRQIALLYGLILLAALIYFIRAFPPPFLEIYYTAAMISSISLIIVLSLVLSIQNKRPAAASLDKFVIFFIALSIAMGSIFLLFYYWVKSMTYVSPSQNFAVIPFMQTILEWMYRMTF